LAKNLMDQNRYRRSMKVLWGMVLVGIMYMILVYFVKSITGIPVIDGGIGVLLGLYICSHPATNAVNLLFADRFAFQEALSDGWGWLALNSFVLLVGWVVIVLGAIQFVQQ